MFERILARLTASAADLTPMPEADARHALGALLVRVAKADGAYLFQEIEEIDHLLADLYDLNAIGAARMRAECEKLEAAMPDTSELANILTCEVTSSERDELVSALWKVADADGQRHDTEQQVVAIATQTFGMAPEAAEALRS
ncbi:TerB family tellurite resistance protein [Octadecabacter sp. 1_MG-2023]|uniref:tellurite resistance TerB family protein n=1 Tax=unclassified Octadecabacter TaxID=196158 RepID=UPI001C08F374|nr:MULTISPECIES: TerB family tellurite resistance protein [unclassified Octadecabacter]MBU2992849.1 TerB family tellurite resistance protein [Octadecabacter sp. B2R22]MDO6733700.1 TerB family tellurite resistance protein [Octadecabacter sp. 1_MG-2023]